jgi:Predicted 3'-5' exonuclease related to the exonuclease domain of PolB
MDERFWVLDIATAPIDGVEAFVDEPTAPAHYKDPEKIQTYIRDAKAKAVATAALDPDLARVAAIGVWRASETRLGVYPCKTPEEEVATLRALMADYAADLPRIVTFNGFRFDLPVLARRCLYLGLPDPGFDLDRYRSRHIDLWQRLSYHGQVSAHSLSWYCHRFGWPYHKPLDGATEATIFEHHQWADLIESVKADVQTTAHLARHMGIL